MEGMQPATTTMRPHSPVKTLKTEATSNDEGHHPSLGSPIGYIQSCFKSKNGTPRQPSVCAFSRAKLRVLKEIFPNPEHSLQGLGEFSHVWILFVFHKNGGGKFTKAKVKPPRLDGAKVGVFATRSPHRPNPIGLTLAKLDRIEGEILHLSGIDIIDGTPVLDIKPYVPSYDNPDHIQLDDQTLSTNLQSGRLPTTDKPTSSTDQMSSNSGTNKSGFDFQSAKTHHTHTAASSEVAECSQLGQNSCENGIAGKQPNLAKTSLKSNSDTCAETDSEQSGTNGSARNPPTHPEPKVNAGASVSTGGREVRGQSFPVLSKEPNNLALRMEPSTQSRSSNSEISAINSGSESQGRVGDSAGATEDSAMPGENSDEYPCRSKVGVADWIQCPPIKTLDVRFTAHADTELENFKKGNSDPNYSLEFLRHQQEAKQAISKILEADPRSTYRRNNCQDRLYYFTVDTLHVTCWFGTDFVEVLQVQPVSFADIP